MYTDGNAIAGLLEEVFGRDVTAVRRICQSCETPTAVGQHHVYRGAGLVLRCPACGHVAASFVERDEGHGVTMYGRWLFAETE